MLQKDNLFEWRSIYKNVMLGLEINNKKTPENIAYVNHLLEQYDLAEFKSARPSQLSGGMRQRAAPVSYTHLHPEKNTAPLPCSPDMHGSSHICRAALAAYISLVIPQKPVLTFLSTLQALGHRLHFISSP